jgi:hypothetical protein
MVPVSAGTQCRINGLPAKVYFGWEIIQYCNIRAGRSCQMLFHDSEWRFKYLINRNNKRAAARQNACKPGRALLA